jgi:hypothetical protein
MEIHVKGRRSTLQILPSMQEVTSLHTIFIIFIVYIYPTNIV